MANDRPPYTPEAFGADGIRATEDWRGSGYTHYTAWKKDGGQISWNEVELADGTREIVDGHLSSMNIHTSSALAAAALLSEGA